MSKSAKTARISCQSFSATLPAGDVPEWVHLLPIGEVQTVDDRGPYYVRDVAKIIENSLSLDHEFLIDVNHSTDIAAAQGQRADAFGWIKELKARDDGLWGRVEWNAVGRELLENRAYRGLSPVIFHDDANEVHAIARASLVNRPNLHGLVALNSPENETGL